jgi:hypothetical protein
LANSLLDRVGTGLGLDANLLRADAAAVLEPAGARPDERPRGVRRRVGELAERLGADRDEGAVVGAPVERRSGT